MLNKDLEYWKILNAFTVLGIPEAIMVDPMGNFSMILIPFYKAQSLKRGILFLILKGGIFMPQLFIEAWGLFSVLTLIFSIVFLSKMIYKLPPVLPCLGGLQLSQGSVYYW